MANLAELYKKEMINFTLTVKASRQPDGPIEFTLDLNPDARILEIDETYSTRKELAEVFGRINKVLDEIDERSRIYNDVIEINQEVRKKYQLTDGYEENFEPSFGKIDKIVHRRNSPKASGVSYTRRYDGDKKPD
jgi:hypothetical protein